MANREFQVHKLNEMGMAKAKGIATNFDILLTALTVEVAGQGAMCPESRELALAKEHLELACFYAKKAMAQQPENQDGYDPNSILPKSAPAKKDAPVAMPGSGMNLHDNDKLPSQAKAK